MGLAAILLYATLGACAVLVGWLVVRYDLYEREPMPMLVLATALGAGAMFGAGQVQLAVIPLLHGSGRPITNTEMALLAGGSEEGAKLIVVAAVALCCRRFFNEPIDGLIYGSFAGLGAALEESLAVLSYGPPTALLPMQEPVRLAGHLVMGGIGGFGVGLLAMGSRWAVAGIALCLLAATGLHTLWDVVAFDAADAYAVQRQVRPWHTASAIGIMLVGMVLYRSMVSAGSRLAREHAAAEAPEGADLETSATRRGCS